jgi:hypothetical protein
VCILAWRLGRKWTTRLGGVAWSIYILLIHPSSYV